MNSKNQKDAFLNGEVDKYFFRNKNVNIIDSIENCSYPLISFILDLPIEKGPNINILEKGCGQALRLKKLNKNIGWIIQGVDPSEHSDISKEWVASTLIRKKNKF